MLSRSLHARTRALPALRWLGLLLVGLLASVGRSAQAEVRQGPVLIVTPDETVNEDLYAFGREIIVRGTINGDLVAFGGTVRVEGAVRGDVMAAGGTVELVGRIGGSARIAGSNLFVRSPINGDLAAAGGQLDIGPGTIARDLFIAGGEAVVHGPVQRDLRAAVGELTLRAPVGGNLRQVGDQLHLANGASVAGNLHYTSPKPLQRDAGASVAGGIDWTRTRGPRGPVVFLIRWLRSIIGLFVLGGLLLLLAPRFVQRTEGSLQERPWESLGVGAAALVGIPLLAAVIFAIGVALGGWWIGLFALGLYALGLAMTFPMIALYLGHWLTGHIRQLHVRRGALAVSLLMGLVVLTLLLRIPVLGFLIALATLLFGLGAMLLALWRGRTASRAI